MSRFNRFTAAKAPMLTPTAWGACFVAVLACTGAIAETTLITTNQYPIPTTKDIRTIALDLPDILEDEISANLPANQAEAREVSMQRLTPDLTAQITQAHQNVTDAWSMGVTKVPAVVLDHKYVVYGETNVQLALDRIEEYRRSEP